MSPVLRMLPVLLCAVLASGAAVVAQAAGGPTPVATTLYLLAYVSGGAQSALSGLASLRRGRLDVDALMVLAAAGAAYIGAWDEGAVLLFLFSLSNALQALALDRTRRAVQTLLSMHPDTACVLRDGEEVTIPVDAVRPGDRIRVRPGERIPLDGVVTTGTSYVDQSPVTGESVPVWRGPGEPVYAGALNGHGSLVVEVTRGAADSTLMRIARLVQAAQSEPSPTQRRLERAEQAYAVAVLAVATALGILPPVLGDARWEDAVYRAITLLVVASPCAVVIAAPAAHLSAVARAARLGFLIKGARHLEALADVTVVAFDKTGTLSQGRPVVVEVVPVTADRAEVLRLAAAVERGSEHPLARAIVASAEAEGLPPAVADGVTAHPGEGAAGVVAGVDVWVGNPRKAPAPLAGASVDAVARLEAEGKTVVAVAAGGRLAGLVALRDELRPGARQAVSALRELGVRRQILLTGDNASVAAALAAAAGLDGFRAGLLPDDKHAVVRSLVLEGEVVAMVGDGINDTPALAAAHVGIAMGAGGTDAALETADVVLADDDIARLPALFELARATRRTLVWGLAFAVGVIAVFATATIAGAAVPLPLAVVAHEGSTVAVALWGLRLLSFRPRRGAGAADGAAPAAAADAAEATPRVGRTARARP
ncbi:MAG: cation-translocating P-type ATPase [Clostridia bacterium]|nr:cation-translocating P-type ATPase [Clostridia bacterium]